jgi:Flp pilus assembly pilin Flp
MVEYSLILFLVSLAAISMLAAVGTDVQAMYAYIRDAIDSVLA